MYSWASFFELTYDFTVFQLKFRTDDEFKAETDLAANGQFSCFTPPASLYFFSIEFCELGNDKLYIDAPDKFAETSRFSF